VQQRGRRSGWGAGSEARRECECVREMREKKIEWTTESEGKMWLVDISLRHVCPSQMVEFTIRKRVGCGGSRRGAVVS
jgi:hypothetical protein